MGRDSYHYMTLSWERKSWSLSNPPVFLVRYEGRVAKSKESFSVLFANIEVSVERVHLVQRKEHENKPAGDGSPWAC